MGTTREREWVDGFHDWYFARSRWIRIPLGLVTAPFFAVAIGTLAFTVWVILAFDRPQAK